MDIFYNHLFDANADPFDTTSKAGKIATSLIEHPVPGVELVTPSFMDEERTNLWDVHAAEYVAAVLDGTEPLASSSGLAWNSDTPTAAGSQFGGCIAAAQAAWADKTIAGTLSSGLHHASHSTGKGFCTFNGVAGAAIEFLRLGAEKVLILDLDAHFGGGTADILGDNPRVVAIDVSTDSYDGYRRPLDWSAKLVTDGSRYKETLARTLRIIAETAPDAIVYNAGVDPHQGDDIGGLTGITDETLAWRDERVFEWAVKSGVPLAFTMAGGYSTPQHSPIPLHRRTIVKAALALDAEALQ